jgi:L-fuculose-phosphate aldolase
VFDRPPKNEDELRQLIVDHCKWLSSQNLNQLTTGNVSVRIPRPVQVNPGANEVQSESDMESTSRGLDADQFGRILVTPSGQSYASLTPGMIVRMNMQGEWEGELIPSSEWRFHVDILQARPEINAVVHTHSMFATILSMTRQPLPAGHYLIAMLGGNDIRCAPYARFGSQQLSDYAVAALDGRMACLLSNHGAIAVGTSLKQAVENAVLLETLAQQYYYAKLAGVCLLTAKEVAETRLALDELSTYQNR